MLNPHAWCVALFLSAALGTTACELEGGGTSPDASPDATDTSNTAVDTAEPDTSTCTLPGGCQDYRFVRVDDLSELTAGDWPGADIDAVVLVKPDGQRIFANRAAQFERASGTLAEALDPNEALGAPDGFIGYPGDTSACSLYKDEQACVNNDTCELTYVSLGGVGGYLVVEMPEAIEGGDSIQVLEIGGCDFTDHHGDPGRANRDPIQIQVSVSDEPDGTWVVVSDSGTGPVITATVPTLPEVPAE